MQFRNFFFSKFSIFNFPYKKFNTTKIKAKQKMINFIEFLYLKKNIIGNRNIVVDNKFNE